MNTKITKVKVLAVAALVTVFATVVGANAVRAITISGPAAINIDADPAQPSAITAPLGSTGNVLSIFRFTETSNSEDVNVTSFTVLASTSASVDPFNNVELWNGPTLVGTSAAAAPVAGGFDYAFNFGSPVVIPQGGSISLTLKGGADAFVSGANGATFIFLIDPQQLMAAVGSSSNQPATVSCDASTLETVTIGGVVQFNQLNQVSGGAGNTPTAEIGVAVGVDNPIPVEGSTINYTVTVTSIGPSMSMGVVANDLLPSGITFVSATTSIGTYNNTTGAWAVGTLNNGSAATLSITATVNASTTGQIINNTATVHESTSLNDPLMGNNSSTAQVVVGGQVLGASTTASSSTDLLGDLLAQLKALERQFIIGQFQAVPCTFSFTKDLSFGTTDSEVKNLQIALNYSFPTQIAGTGAGSVGNESTFFGTSTQNAVIVFQNIFGLTANGTVGSSTRVQLNTLCGQ